MHHEPPERLDVHWYRKRARELLRDFRAGEISARERVHDVVGQRSPIKLSDASMSLPWSTATSHGRTSSTGSRRADPVYGHWAPPSSAISG
jgi:hypothetical protein